MTQDVRQERRLEVLKAVVRSFIATGEPVGSRAVAGAPGCEVSPATVRNVMAELETLGYLSQPHPSAGRVPTEAGLGAFVDLVLREGRYEASADSQPMLAEASFPDRADVPAMLAETSRTLSRLCGCVGVVLRPAMGTTRFRHAHFLRVDRARLLAVVVDESGSVSDHLVSVEEDYDQAELDRISRYIVNRFHGLSLLEVRETLERELHEERASYDAARRRWARLVLAVLEPCVGRDEVYVEGAAACARSPEFATVERLRQLLSAYEEKGRIARLLRNCLDRHGIQCLIGDSGGDGAGLAGLALVAVRCGDERRSFGSVGVLGPVRMEYERVIAVVDRVGRDLGRMLGEAYGGSQ